MDSEFNTLAEKIDQLIHNCEKLRANNLALRQQIAGIRNENDILSNKVKLAIGKLEKLIQQHSTGK